MGFWAAIGAFLRGLWRVLDGLRRVLHLILLLVIFGILLVATRSSLPILPTEAALVIEPAGRIVEELSGDPLERALDDVSGRGEPETRLQDLLDAIDHARDDDRVRAIVLDVGGLEGASLAKLQDLAKALQAFRASGKQVLVWGESFDQKQYLLAAQADEVYLDPLGAVLVEGYGQYRNYFRGALDKLAVTVNVFKVGDHKSAPEEWIRQDISPEDREQAMALLGALWSTWKQDVARARGLEPEVLQQYADGYAAAAASRGGDLAALAVDAKLVDGLMGRSEFIDLVAGRVGEGEPDERGFSAIELGQYLTVLRSEKALERDAEQNVGVIVASGEILDGVQPSGTVGGESLAMQLLEARDAEDVQAVVLRIDSPGGSLAASEEIRRAILAVKEAGKPVVASMGGVAASGGYYIAMDADRIIAAPSTVTGSIGVFAVIPTFEGTLGKVGVTTDGVGTTRLSGAFRLDRPLSDDVRSILTSAVGFAYRQFIESAAKGRGRKPEEIEAVAQGRVWTGEQALESGLVDELGDLDTAIAAAAKAANLDDGYGTRYLKPHLDWREALAMRLQSAAAPWVGKAVGLHTDLLPPGAVGLEREVRRLTKFATRDAGRPLAYCGCELD